MSDDTNNRPAILAMRLETRKLIDELSKATRNVGDVITDAELRNICGADCGTNQRGYVFLRTAIRRVAKDNQIYWERIHGAGAIKRLLPDEAIGSARRDRETIARRAKWGMTKLRTIDTKSLAPGKAAEINATAAQLGTLAVFASGKAEKALEVRQANAPLDLPKLLEAFGK